MDAPGLPREFYYVSSMIVLFHFLSWLEEKVEDCVSIPCTGNIIPGLSLILRYYMNEI